MSIYFNLLKGKLYFAVCLVCYQFLVIIGKEFCLLSSLKFISSNVNIHKIMLIFWSGFQNLVYSQDLVYGWDSVF